MNKIKVNDIIETMGQWFAKLPPLPKNWVAFLVRITPWFALIFGILGLISILNFVFVLPTLQRMPSLGLTGNFNIILIFVIYVLWIAALKGTRARKIKGWKLLFWSEIIAFIGGLITTNSIISTIVFSFIGFYLLFQIKPYYK